MILLLADYREGALDPRGYAERTLLAANDETGGAEEQVYAVTAQGELINLEDGRERTDPVYGALTFSGLLLTAIQGTLHDLSIPHTLIRPDGSRDVNNGWPEYNDVQVITAMPHPADDMRSLHADYAGEREVLRQQILTMVPAALRRAYTDVDPGGGDSFSRFCIVRRFERLLQNATKEFPFIYDPSEDDFSVFDYYDCRTNQHGGLESSAIIFANEV